MVNKKIFQFSCDYVGFKVEIDLNDCDNLHDVVKLWLLFVYNSFLDSNNLFVLKEKIKNINYHVHDYTFEELLVLEYNNNEKLHGFICGHH